MEKNVNGPSTVFTTFYHSQRRHGAPFAPGIFFILLGLLVVLAPRLLVGAVATLFIFVGAVACYVAWKIAQFKRHLREVAQQVEIKAAEEKVRAAHPDIELDESDYQKIIFH
jgi:hypothetical protein